MNSTNSTSTPGSRTTRSRGGPINDGDNNISFDKPATISKSGRYTLNGPESGCSISLFENIFTPKYLQNLQTVTDSLPTLKQYSVKRLDGTHKMPRLSAWYGPADYEYAGVHMKAYDPNAAPDAIAAYKHITEHVLLPNGIACDADSFLINKYRNERDSCGEHSDDEPIINQTSPIVSLSLGNPRIFLIREKGKSGNTLRILLNPGSVFVMSGPNFQAKYTHQIPKESHTVLSRTSYTFRKCDPVFLGNLMKTSVPLLKLKTFGKATEIPVMPSPLPLKQRRLSKGSLMSSGPGSPNSIDSRVSKADREMFPLSLAAITEAIDFLKETTLKQELQRYELSTIGGPTDKKKRLKKAVQDFHKKELSNNLDLIRSAEPEFVTDCVKSSITTLETSILELQQEITLQRISIESLPLYQPDSAASKKSDTATQGKLAIEMGILSRRIEKIEDSLDRLNGNQTELTESLEESNKTLGKVASQTAETCTRLRQLQHPEAFDRKPPPMTQNNSQPSQNQPRRANHERTPWNMTQNNSQPSQKQSRRVNHERTPWPSGPKPKAARKVLLIHDSQLAKFDPSSFSASFSVEKLKAGKYSDLNSTHMRTVISKPNIDSYILQLGINDYRYDPTPEKVKKAVEETKNSINTLLMRSSAKVLVCLPTPTPGCLDSYTQNYNKSISEFITDMRSSSDNFSRLFTVNNYASFKRLIDLCEHVTDSDCACPLEDDMLHINEYGLKKLCTSIKFGLYRCFGISPPSLVRRNPSK